MYVDWTLLVFSGNHPKLPLFLALPLALSTQLKRRSNLLELVLSASESGRHRPTCQHTSLQEIFLKNSKKIRVTPMDPFLRPLNHFLSKYEWEKWKFWPFWSLGDPKNEKRPKKGFLGILKDPQAYPDFFRIFTFLMGRVTKNVQKCENFPLVAAIFIDHNFFSDLYSVKTHRFTCTRLIRPQVAPFFLHQTHP